MTYFLLALFQALTWALTWALLGGYWLDFDVRQSLRLNLICAWRSILQYRVVAQVASTLVAAFRRAHLCDVLNRLFLTLNNSFMCMGENALGQT